MVDLVIEALPLLMRGALMTLQIALIASLGSFLLGSLMGLVIFQKLPFISPLLEGIAFTLRAVPFYVQLLLVYFVIPDLFGLTIETFWAAVTALAVCSSGYVAQIVRGGMQQIPDSQEEAALVLGYSYLQRLRYVMLPQMLRYALPSLHNELEALLKSTAVVSSIGLLELTRMGMNIVSRKMQPLPIYLLVALFYLLISVLFFLVARRLERYATC